MKKLLSVLTAAALALSLAACGSTADTAAADTGAADDTAAAAPAGTGEAITLKVAASPAPHAEILEVAKEVLAKQNITLDIITFDDYVQPNTVTEDEEVNANYFQHGQYLADFNQNNGTHLVSVAAIHYEPFGLYAGKTATLDELADGAQIAVPNDPSNEARALQVLAGAGLITLAEDAGAAATVNDIVDNPKNIEVVEIEAAQLPRTLADVDMAVINGNYAIEAGLSIADAVAVEEATDTVKDNYANLLVVKEGHENDPGIAELVAALQGDEVHAFIDEHYNGAVIGIG